MTITLPRSHGETRLGVFAALAFLWLALPTGLFLAIAVPPGLGLEESQHAMRAGGLALGRLSGHRSTVDLPSGPARLAGVNADLALLGVAVAHQGPATQVTWQEMETARQWTWRGAGSFIPLGATAAIFPLFHAPAAAVMAAAPALGVTPFNAILAARVAGFTVFALLAGAALALARRGQAVLFCILAVPTCQALAASINPEGLGIAAVALASVLISRRAPDSPLDRGFAVAAFLLGAVVLVRPPLLPLLALLLLPIGASWRQLRARAAVALLAAIPAVIWLGRIALHIAADAPIAPYAAGPLWPGEPAMLPAVGPLLQSQVVLAHPFALVSSFLQALGGNGWQERQMIGVLGTLTVPLPDALYVVWRVAIVAAVLGELAGGTARRGLRDAGLAGVVVLAAALATCLWLYLWLTPVGATTVAGLQGSLLLALLPPLAVALPRLGAMPLRAPCLAIAALAAAITLAWLPAVVIDGLYLR